MKVIKIRPTAKKELKMSFTKGPWFFKNCTVYMHQDVTPIAYTGARFDIFGKGMEECESNARLIAAAPDLLFALEQTLHSLLPYDKNGNMNKIVDIVNDAIFKATGKPAEKK